MDVLQKLLWITFSLFHMAFCDFAAETPWLNLSKPVEDEFILAQVIYRHGNRSLLYTYANDPYKNYTGNGILTEAGKQRQFKLGKYLRKRYEKYIGAEFSPENVYIRSSDTNRTINSALCNAAGMFAPPEQQRWQSDLNWPPIPIHTVPLNDDYLVYQAIPCPKRDEQIHDYSSNSSEVDALFRKHRKLLEYMEQHSGKKIQTIQNAGIFWDPLSIEENLGLALPDWANNVLNSSRDLLEYFSAANFQMITHTTEMKKTIAGFLIRDIFDRFRNRTLSSTVSSHIKLFIYSAHDNTIINTLNALNLYDMRIPPPAASLHFEMYRRELEYYIQMFYRKNEFEDVPPLEFPGCGIKCPLNDLYQIYAAILPTDSEDYHSLCRLDSTMGVVVLWKIIWNVLFLLSHAGDAYANKDGELIFANTVCRHGDRNIFRPYPTDPWRDEKHWPGGYSALTSVGKQQHYILGQYLRRRYARLLVNGEYSPNRVYVRSTDTDRTIMSGAANLAGFFPPVDYQIWNEDIHWHPIPIHTQPTDTDYLLATTKQCDRFDYEMTIYLNESNYKGLLEQHKLLIEYLERNSGMELNSITAIFLLYDGLFIERINGKRLPDWAQNVMTPGGNFEFLAMLWYRLHSSTNYQKKIKAGYLLKDIFDRFSAKIHSTLSPDRTIYLYFAHDITITNVLNSLGLYNVLEAPTYAGCLFFELYKVKSEWDHYVQIYYKNSIDTEITALHIPKCGIKCPLDKLYALYDDILPTQSFTKECKLRDGEVLPPGGNPESYTFLTP
ncbi:uncharacterized protein LOC116349297 [Contarinia nasturtii]|uniref:uncharacterized protein LOC116349297 n=1 Tax=Contarinia nasturtii TaxID=265458 RepID=UPI0012D45C54|nr:uncharacterized protein LOC116349297 [Contarinia nasturtii]